jgi:hypothetical protein
MYPMNKRLAPEVMKSNIAGNDVIIAVTKILESIAIYHFYSIFSIGRTHDRSYAHPIETTEPGLLC